jgi:hypothetical protein
LRRITSPNCDVNELVTPAPFDPSVITPTNPLGISINNLVALVLVLKVAAIPAEEEDAPVMVGDGTLGCVYKPAFRCRHSECISSPGATINRCRHGVAKIMNDEFADLEHEKYTRNITEKENKLQKQMQR